MQKHPVLIVGGSGMAGGELLRILAGHPAMEVVGVVSRGRAGHPVAAVHPHLRPDFPNTPFISPGEAETLDPALVFLALPHGSSAPVIRGWLDRGVKVADLAADVRLRSPELYERWYGGPHPDPALLGEAVYGLPELHRDEIRAARLVSGVGCNATASILAIAPLARAGVVTEARIEARVGSSEGGSKASEGSHHPYRSRALRMFEPFAHRHLAEVSQETGLPEDRLTLGVTAVESVRGVQAVATVTLADPLREADLWKLYRGAYGTEPFVHVCPARPAHLRLPDPRLVMGSNRALVGFALHPDGRRLTAVCSIDNLLKGASGTAVQAANLLLGCPETAGLDMRPVYPA
jgi:N-acetyl-gamma-glutamyl-phosphate/LysW-gamma-L-alpha-aminoadipyl-6-phosphate reductase